MVGLGRDSPEPLVDRDLDTLLLPWQQQLLVLDQQVCLKLPLLVVLVSLDLPALQHLGLDVLGSLEEAAGDDNEHSKALNSNVLVLNTKGQVRVEHEASEYTHKITEATTANLGTFKKV